MQNSKDAAKDLASQVEVLARLVQEKIDLGEDFMPACNDLVRNVITLVFTAGEFFALDQLAQSTNTKKRSVRVVKSGDTNYRHNVRNSLGRFVKVGASI